MEVNIAYSRGPKYDVFSNLNLLARISPHANIFSQPFTWQFVTKGKRNAAPRRSISSLLLEASRICFQSEAAEHKGEVRIGGDSIQTEGC